MLEYNLIISGNPNFIAEDCIKNWDEISYSMKRDGFSGIVRSFSSQFEFTNEAYSMLVEEYIKNGVNADAQIEIYELGNDRGKVFLFGSKLDYGSFEYNDSVAYINAADATLSAKIKAKKSTQFEYDVESLKEGLQLEYDRMLMNSKVEWLYVGTYENDARGEKYTNEFSTNSAVPVYIENSEISVKNVVEVKDSQIGSEGHLKDAFFFRNTCKDNITAHLCMNFSFSFLALTSGANMTVELRLYDVGGNSQVLHKISLNVGASRNDFNYENKSLVIPPNSRLVFCAMVSGKCKLIQKVSSSSSEKVVIEFYKKDVPVLVDVIKPQNLLNQLLKSINDGKDGFIGEIDQSDIRMKDTLLVAAESVRGIKGAKVYTSLKKFSQWLEAVFGYVPLVDNNKLIYKKRDSLYNPEKQCEIKNAGYDFNVKLESKNIYSTFKVGFEKQEYDSVNGRDEFRFTNEYDTGITITDNVLELVSPLRADAYGIEFLAAKRGEDTTDSDSDKDLFFVAAAQGERKYTLVRDGYTSTGLISSDTMFNMMFSPRACIESNRKYIASFFQKLKFASSEGNSDVVINDVAEKSDVSFTESEGLFSPSVLSVETAEGKLPSDIHGLVEIRRGGFLYQCFVNEAKYKLGLYEGIKYELQIKSITRI